MGEPEWLCFGTNPRRDRYANEMAGRRQHAFGANGRRSLCGRVAKYGTCCDLHNDKKCAACLRRLGLACPACRGVGATGSIRAGTWSSCCTCRGTGERAALAEGQDEEGKPLGVVEAVHRGRAMADRLRAIAQAPPPEPDDGEEE